MVGQQPLSTLVPLRHSKQTCYLSNSDYLILETRHEVLLRGKALAGGRKFKASHHINYPTVDESRVSGLKRDWVAMHLWQNHFCQVPDIRWIIWVSLQKSEQVRTCLLQEQILKAWGQFIIATCRSFSPHTMLLDIVLATILWHLSCGAQRLYESADSFGFVLAARPVGHHYF